MQGILCVKKFPGRNPRDQEGIGFFNVARLHDLRFGVLPVISCDFSTTWYINQKIRQHIGVLIRQPAIDPKPESERTCVNVEKVKRT